MSSLIIAFILALLASIFPYLSTGEVNGESLAAIGILTLLLWPIVALARAVVGWLYRFITGRPAP